MRVPDSCSIQCMSVPIKKLRVLERKHTHKHIDIYNYMRTDTYKYIKIYNHHPNLDTYTHTFYTAFSIHTHVRTDRTFAYMHACIHTYIHTYKT
jgi:hypothetical protein